MGSQPKNFSDYLYRNCTKNHGRQKFPINSKLVGSQNLTELQNLTVRQIVIQIVTQIVTQITHTGRRRQNLTKMGKFGNGEILN